MVIGAIALLYKLGKAILVTNAVISSLHHSLLTDRKALGLSQVNGNYVSDFKPINIKINIIFKMVGVFR